MPYPYASDCAAPDQCHHITCNNPVAALQRQFWSAWVWEAYVVAPGKEVNLPGSISNCLLAVRGSKQPVCDRTSTINEMRVVFGRKH
jgi:hypothetical protein